MNGLKAMLDLLRDNILKHDVTPTTYELLGVCMAFDNMSFKDLVDGGLDVALAHKLHEAFIKEDVTAVCDHYVMADYSRMFVDLHKILTRIEWADFDDIYNRQMIIQFPADHCVQYMQFLVRSLDRESITLFAINNMRSCNFEYNFLPDAYIAYMCAHAISEKIMRAHYVHTKINVVMQIGSLHIFKKDVEGKRDVV